MVPPYSFRFQTGFCWQTWTVTVTNEEQPPEARPPSPILGAPDYHRVPIGDMASSEGRLNYRFNQPQLTLPDAGEYFTGIPVTGFFVTIFDNAFVPGGTLANYAASFRHHREQAIYEPYPP